MILNLPSKVRATLYVITALGSPVITYLALRGTIGELEVGLWTGLVTAVSTMAAINTDTNDVY
jgi:hypothetical protein